MRRQKDCEAYTNVIGTSGGLMQRDKKKSNRREYVEAGQSATVEAQKTAEK